MWLCRSDRWCQRHLEWCLRISLLVLIFSFGTSVRYSQSTLKRLDQAPTLLGLPPMSFHHSPHLRPTPHLALAEGAFLTVFKIMQKSPMLADYSCVWLRWVWACYTWLMEKHPAHRILWAAGSLVMQPLLPSLVPFLTPALWSITITPNHPTSPTSVWLSLIFALLVLIYHLDISSIVVASQKHPDQAIILTTSTKSEPLLSWLHSSPSRHGHFIVYHYALRYLQCLFLLLEQNGHSSSV